MDCNQLSEFLKIHNHGNIDILSIIREQAFHKSHLLKLRVAPSETAMTDVLREVLLFPFILSCLLVNSGYLVLFMLILAVGMV